MDAGSESQLAEYKSLTSAKSLARSASPFSAGCQLSATATRSRTPSLEISLIHCRSLIMPGPPQRRLLVDFGLELVDELCLAAVKELRVELERQLGRQFLCASAHHIPPTKLTRRVNMLYGNKLGRQQKNASSKQSSSIATLAASDNSGLRPSGNFFLSTQGSVVSQ